MIRRRIRRVRISQRTRISKRNYSVEISTSSCVTDSSDVSVSSCAPSFSKSSSPCSSPPCGFRRRALPTIPSTVSSTLTAMLTPTSSRGSPGWLFCRLLLAQSVILLFLSSAAPASSTVVSIHVRFTQRLLHHFELRRLCSNSKCFSSNKFDACVSMLCFSCNCPDVSSFFPFKLSISSWTLLSASLCSASTCLQCSLSNTKSFEIPLHRLTIDCRWLNASAWNRRKQSRNPHANARDVFPRGVVVVSPRGKVISGC